MLALLGLLLLGAEPSSHDLLTGKVYSTLDGDNSRAFATHVVHHHANDSNTMHNHEDSQTTCDQRPRLGNAICDASPRVHRSHHALAAPAMPVELSCAIAAPAKPVELSCAFVAPDLSVELSHAVGLPAHGHCSTQHHKVSTYCLDNNTSTSMPMSTPMRTPVSTPAAPIAALDTRISPTQPPPSPNVMMTTTLDNGAATSEPLRPARRGCSDTGHTATALCSCNVHRLPAPNADTNKSLTTTRSGRRPPSTYRVASPAALLLPSGTTQQIELDLTHIAASNPTTIAAQPHVTAGPSLWLSQSCSTECREGPPSQAPADHADVPTHLARRGSRCLLQYTLCWNSSWTLAFLAPHAAHRASLSPPAACLDPPTAHDASPSLPVACLTSPAAHYASPSPATHLLALPSTGYPSPSPPAPHLLTLPSARYPSPSPPAIRLLDLPSASYPAPSPPATRLLGLPSASYPCAVAASNLPARSAFCSLFRAIAASDLLAYSVLSSLCLVCRLLSTATVKTCTTAIFVATVAVGACGAFAAVVAVHSNGAPAAAADCTCGAPPAATATRACGVFPATTAACARGLPHAAATAACARSVSLATIAA